VHTQESVPLELEVAALRVWLTEREAMLIERDATIEKLNRDLALLCAQVERLLRGGRRNDQLAPGQGLLFAPEPTQVDADASITTEQSDADSSTCDDAADKARRARRAKAKAARNHLDLSLLAREEIVHDLPEAERICPVTGLARVEVGEKVQEELHYQRGKLTVKVHRRKVYGLSEADAEERKVDPVTAPMPVMPFDDCVAGASFVAALLMNKYGDHLPLYRQESIFERQGLRLPRRLTGEWALRGTELLAPIVEHMFNELRSSSINQLDDTPVKCQGGKGGKMRQARLWTFTSPEFPHVVFQFTSGRGADGIVEYLEPMAGFLVGDGLQVNKNAADKAGAKLVVCGCWAHALRKFRDAVKSHSAVAKLYMHDIGELYAIEREADGANAPPTERLRMRMARAPVILARMHERLKDWRAVGGNVKRDPADG
jgi:transposase